MPDDPLPETIAFPGARLRPGRSERRAVGLFLVLACIVGVGAWVMGMPPWMGIPALLLTAMAVQIHRLSRKKPRGGGLVEVRDDGLYAEGCLALAREALTQAVVSREARGWVVSIYGRLGLVAVVEVADEEEGQALVKALGFDATQALSAFPFDGPASLLPRWVPFLWIASFFLGLIIPNLFGLWWLPIPVLLAWFALGVLGGGQTSLLIGLDGLLVYRPFRYEFIHFTDLRAVDHDGTRLLLDVADGRRRVLSARWSFIGTATDVNGFASRGAYLDAVVARVREVLVASRAGAGPVVAALGRKNQDLGAWVRSLRGLARRGAGDYRNPATVLDQLWSTVEDGGAMPVTRAAAAIALAPALGGADRERLQAVARVVVSPRLRVAIEAAARDDDAATLEAMATLEQGGEERPAGEAKC